MSFKSYSNFCSLICAPALLVSVGKAETAAVAQHEILGLEPFAVTATRTEVEVNDAPGSLTLLTREQLELRPAGRVGDVLRSVPGVYASSNVLGQGVPSAQGGRFSVRGISGSSRTLVLLDNLPLNDPYLGNVNWASVFLDEVQRVEVLPGGGSALYGGNAFAGVVHIITREPEARESFVRVRYQNGGVEQREGTVLYRDRLRKRVGLSLGYTRLDSEGYDGEMDVVKTASAGAVPTLQGTGAVRSQSTTGAEAWVVGHAATRPWSAENAQAKLSYTFDSGAKLRSGVLWYESKLRFGDSSSFVRDAAGLPLYSGIFNMGGSRVVVTEANYLNAPSTDAYTRLYAFFDQLVDKRLQFSTGVSYTDRTRKASSVGTAATRLGGSGSLTDSPTKMMDFFAQVSGAHGRANHWVAGLNWNRGEMDRSSWSLSDWRDLRSTTSPVDAAFGRTDNASVFLQEEVNIGERTTLYLGGRYDKFRTRGRETLYGSTGLVTDNDFGTRDFGQFSPRVALVNKPWDGARLRASVGRAFRSPTLFDYYVVSRRGTTVTLSNPQLKPETSWAYESSLTQTFGKGRTEFTLTGFGNELEDLIYSKTLSTSTRQSINAGRAWTRGLELKLRQRVMDGVQLTVAGTLTRSRMVENEADPSSVGKELVNAPRRLFSTVLEGRRGKWSGSVGAYYVDKSYDTAANVDVVSGVYGSFASYWLFNAQAGYELRRNFEVVLACENLLDREYFQFTREPGRLVSLSFRFSF